MMQLEELNYVAAEYGTPTFVFDIEEFQTRMQEIRAIFGPQISLCFAMKANPFLISAAQQVADKLEVCSPGELDLCMGAGIEPQKIVYSGVNKQLADIGQAIAYGAGVLTAESRLHVDYLEQAAAEAGMQIDVLLRLNAGSQFGMSREDFLGIIDNRANYSHVHFVGIHYFVGTQRHKIKHQAKELGMLDAFIDELQAEHGFKVERLEYGPGLAVPYFVDDDFSNTLAPAREIAPVLQDIAQKVELTVEMGRFFAASCGAYLTRVMDMKSNEGTNYCIFDGGMNHLTYSGQMMGMHTPIIENLSHAERFVDAGSAMHWCMCGSLCTVNDVAARDAELVDLRQGDVLAFLNAGAYSVTEGVYLFLSRTMPRIILRYSEQQHVLVRDFVESSLLNEVRM